MSSSKEKVRCDHDAIISQLSEEERVEYDKMCVADQAIYLTSRKKKLPSKSKSGYLFHMVLDPGCLLRKKTRLSCFQLV